MENEMLKKKVSGLNRKVSVLEDKNIEMRINRAFSTDNELEDLNV